MSSYVFPTETIPMNVLQLEAGTPNGNGNHFERDPNDEEDFEDEVQFAEEELQPANNGGSLAPPTNDSSG